MNHAPTILKASGKIIKQGDTSSLLVFELQNSLHKPMSELEGKQATVTFKCDDGIAFRKTLTVTESKIQFSIDTVLAVGVYDVEVTCEGYIFPSSPTVTIQVTQSHKEYTDVAPLEEVPSMDAINNLIAQSRYDDSELREFITQLSNREDKDTIYDDSNVKERLTTLENRPEPVAYDDAPLQLEIRRLATSSSELAEKVQALEERPDVDISAIERQVKDISLNISGISGRLEYVELETSRLNNYDDSALRRDIADIKQQLSIRRPPSAWCLDRSTKDNWTIWFDNGCGLVLRDYNKSATIYGYGFMSNTETDRWDNYPIVQSIIKVARGYITIDRMRSMDSSAWLYFQRNMIVLNPVRDRNRYNWDNAFLNPSDKGYMPWTQNVVIRTMYELGIWSDEDVVGLGAVLVR